jgi:hypothetical protein
MNLLSLCTKTRATILYHTDDTEIGRNWVGEEVGLSYFGIAVNNTANRGWSGVPLTRLHKNRYTMGAK